MSGALPTIKSPLASTIVFDTTVASTPCSAVIAVSISYKYFAIPAVGSVPAVRTPFCP